MKLMSIVSAAFCLIRLQSPAHAAEISQSSFNAAIKLIHQRVVDLTSYDDLFQVPEFRKVYENPKPYEPFVLAFITSAPTDETEHLIAVHGMMRLPFDAYIDFAGSVVDLAEKKKVSSAVLNRAVFPPLDVKTTIPENFANGKVRALLMRIRASKGLQVDREFIDDILAGKVDKQIKELRSAGQLR
jgi:hypothetical protein